MRASEDLIRALMDYSGKADAWKLAELIRIVSQIEEEGNQNQVLAYAHNILEIERGK